MRIGHGYDVHRLVPGRDCIICGVSIPYEKGLDGHSDADVATHALMDALLGASAMGDIGRLFPDTDDKYKNISSMILLDRVIKLLNEKNYKVLNADITIIAQKPKISSFINEMVTNIAEHMNVSRDQVNIKATTEEGLGFTGDGSGISAHAVVLIDNA